jgi:hypothetical protein
MIRKAKPPMILHLNNRSRRQLKKSGPVRLSETVSGPQDQAAKMADRLVTACRENVRFLNFHLQRYENYLETPTLVDNALYLAYTIRVREDAPFDVFTLRRHLADAGIESSPVFSFTSSPEYNYDGPSANRIRDIKRQDQNDSRAFCLACHQYLTILDLQHIVEAFEAIFHHYEKIARATSPDSHDRSHD